MDIEDRDGMEAGPEGGARLLAEAALAEAHARARVSAAAIDLSLPPAARLTDYERTAGQRLLEQLIGAIEDELREGAARALAGLLPDAAIVELEAASASIARPILRRSRLLHDPDLVRLLLRRADEHARTVRIRFADLAIASEGPPSGRLERLIRDDDAAVATAAMALLVAESRRFDAFQDPAVARTDLPAAVQSRLVWQVAAALRLHLVDRRGEPGEPVDEALAAVAADMIADYRQEETLDARALALAEALDAAGRLDDAMLAALAREGHLAVLAAAVSVRGAVALDQSWDLLLEAGGSRLALLLRAIGVGRRATAELLLALDPGDTPDAGLADRIDAFDLTRPDDARAAIRPLRLPAPYRQALDALAAVRAELEVGA